MTAPRITSKHLRTSTELTLVAAIEPKFIRTRYNETISTAARLGMLLDTFFELRRAALERALDASPGPLERLRTVYNFTWTVFDEGRRLLLCVSFDRPWEPYIRSIVDLAGPFLDAIFCHCEGYAGCSTEDGYVRFAEWVRARQIDVSLFYAAEPDLTVDDQRYLREVERLHRELGAKGAQQDFATRVAGLVLGDPGTDQIPPLQAPAAEQRALYHRLSEGRLVRVAAALDQLRQFFAVHHGDPERQTQAWAQHFFDRAAWLLVEPLVMATAALAKEPGNECGAAPDPSRVLHAVLARLPAPLRDMLGEMQRADELGRSGGRALVEAPAEVPACPAVAVPAPPAVALAEIEGHVQGNILTSYEHMTHGCMLLIGFESAEAGRQFLGKLADIVTTHAQARRQPDQPSGITFNVALTFEGFRTLGLTPLELERFPIEFREGMAARAGLLGDVGPEHPENWAGPQRFGGKEPRLVSLSEVDLMLLVQRDLGDARELEWNAEHPLHAALAPLLGSSAAPPGAAPPPDAAPQAADGERPAAAAAKLPSVPGVRVLALEPLQREFMSLQLGPGAGTTEAVMERFGFADGLSQPVVEQCDQGQAGRDRVALGELLLGRGGDRGEHERYPTGPLEYTRDGSFLVVRKLEQNVAALEEFLCEHAPDATARDELYLKLMGRRRDGSSPVSSGTLNEFDYSHDRDGAKCPIASHVRRANPRLEGGLSVHGLPLRVPRLARRGFSFGPFSGSSSPGSRGLMFMAFNASLAEQFEVIQRWLNGANSSGALSAHADPLVSHRFNQVLSWVDGGTPRHVIKKRPFVKLLWGHYFFAPSIDALKRLASLGSERSACAEATSALAARGEALIAGLEAREAGERAQGGAVEGARFEWKRLLEERRDPSSARAVWTAIRERRGGVLRTPYGVLVASAPLVQDVLRDEQRFSAREYGARMGASVGPLYLGMDRGRAGRGTRGAPASDYAKTAPLPNQFMSELGRGAAYELARASALRHFEQLEPLVDLVELAKRTLTDVSRQWFGLPRSRAQYEVFHTAAQYIFFPHPEPGVEGAARELGRELQLSQDEVLAEEPDLARYLRGCPGFEQPQAIWRALVGGAQGTLAATTGSFVSVMNQGLESGRHARWAAWLASDEGRQAARRAFVPAADAREGEHAEPWLVREVLRAMGASPVPELLHRSAVARKRVGHVKLEPGDTVVVSLASAIAGEGGDLACARELVFGGAYPDEERGAQHPCPGREAALGVILGLLVTVLQRDVRREGPLRVSRRAFDARPA